MPAGAEDKTRMNITITGLLAPAKQYLGGNPLDGYPLGLPAGVAGGLSGKYLNHNLVYVPVNRIYRCNSALLEF